MDKGIGEICNAWRIEWEEKARMTKNKMAKHSKKVKQNMAVESIQVTIRK